MYIAYQPIVKLSEREVVGYEALARFEEEQSPDTMFEAAWQDGTGIDLETKAIRMAIEGFPRNIDKAFLAINASAGTIIAMRGDLTADPGLEIPWPNLIIEVSEKNQDRDFRKLDEALALLRQRKARLAIDDYGSGFSSFSRFSQIDPDFIKIDRALIRNIGENSSKRSAVRSILLYAGLERSKVIAEGIETEEELEWCAGLKVEYGQGYLFGRPEPFASASLASNNPPVIQ
jgi:EAL domain-containing protein (putative c-di-GMP-specific phosphodiesterase class I)